MPTAFSRKSDLVPVSHAPIPIGRSSSVPDSPFSHAATGRAARSDIYSRPDIYDMEYAGASNQDA